MALTRNNEAADAMDRNRRLRGIFAGCVIVACLVFVTWSAWPKKDPYVAPPADPVANWLQSYGDLSAQHGKNAGDAFYWASSGLSVQAAPDRQSIVVSGKVKSQAELALVKAEIAKVQPALPIEWKVNVGQ